MPHLLAVPDKFKGTASAGAVAGAMAAGALASGWAATELPMSDGGEGLLEVMGGANRRTVVRGPLGAPVTASWRFEGQAPDGSAPATAVIEMSQAAGLVLAGGRRHNDAVAASTVGVGELILSAVAAGARRLVVGCGGSATTDGGSGALSVLKGAEALAGAELIVACDVRIGFVQAAKRFGPQKGASPAQVALLEGRLGELAGRYRASYGLDVRHLEGAGAAGGLAGGLAAIGGALVSGFDLVASYLGLDDHLATADAVATGEGSLDAESFDGKVVGGVAARRGDRPALCVAGRATVEGARAAGALGLSVVSLSERHGAGEAMSRPLQLLVDVTAQWLGSLAS